ncbi:unnamed protein product [Citrullus colocynthis]|uniref:Uncharacterized protein n=1 Tax=Citrullus colocynthis TaxID=252529 RepID=A0ABP0YGA4_9ROSI
MKGGPILARRPKLVFKHFILKPDFLFLLLSPLVSTTIRSLVFFSADAVHTGSLTPPASHYCRRPAAVPPPPTTIHPK